MLLFLNSPAQAESANSDLNLSINSVVSLSITNCDASNADTITINIDPTNAGVFKSACQNISVAANTPGYSLSIKSSSTDLIYQNPTTLNPKPIVPSTTTGTVAAPAVLPNDAWGFAIENNGNFDTTYIINNQANTYALLPITDQTIYQTDLLPAPLNDFRAYYGAKLTLATIAGTYKTTITYTAIGAEIPDPPLPTMQAFAQDHPLCDSTTWLTTETLRDVRDDKTYRVRCMPTNSWWMIDNLDLVLTDGLILTTDDTNVYAWYSDLNTYGSSMYAVPVGTELSEQQVADKYAPDDDDWTPYSLSIGSLGHLYSARLSNFYEPLDDQIVRGDICPAGWFTPTYFVPSAGNNSGLFSRIYIDLFNGYDKDNSVYDWLADPARGFVAITDPDIFDAKLAGLYWDGAGHVGEGVAGYLWDSSRVISFGGTQGIVIEKGYSNIASSLRCAMLSD
jgi:hypothetical protein